MPRQSWPHYLKDRIPDKRFDRRNPRLPREEQLPLECGPHKRKETIEQGFKRFRDKHPEVELRLVALARKAKRRGRKVGIGALWEVMRWSFWMDDDVEEFKLNNNYRSRYARLLMAQYPDLAGFFETRRLTSKGVSDG